MNRRSFLTSLGAIIVAPAVALKAIAASKPKKSKVSSNYFSTDPNDYLFVSRESVVLPAVDLERARIRGLTPEDIASVGNTELWWMMNNRAHSDEYDRVVNEIFSKNPNSRETFLAGFRTQKT